MPANHREDFGDLYRRLRHDVDQLLGTSVIARTAFPCTSSTRPTSPTKYLVIFETDTNKIGVWTGTTWKLTAALT